MSDIDEPGRWLDGGGDVDSELLAALEATQSDFASDSQLAAVEASLLGAIGGGGGGGGGAGPASIAPKAVAVSYAVPAGIAAAVLVTAGLVAFLWPTETPTAPGAEVADALEVPDPVAADVTPPPDPPTAPTATPAPEPAVAAPAARPLDEGQLLERARRRVRSRPGAALRMLSIHRARFPDGALAEERDALYVEALQRRGRDAEARSALDRFFARYPSSVHRVRLRSLFEE